MNHAFTLAGAALFALPSGALWWPDRGLLCVSDMHFGKSERLARRGGALRAIKNAFDPHGLFNPGKLIPLPDEA